MTEELKKKIEEWRSTHPPTDDGEQECSTQPSTCQWCKGAGWLEEDNTDNPNEPKQRACRCKRDELAKKLRDVLPAEIAACTFDTFQYQWQKDREKRTQLVLAYVLCQDYAVNDPCRSHPCPSGGDNGTDESHPSKWLYIHGTGGSGNGTGKSHLSAAIANEVVAHGRTVVFMRVTQIMGPVNGDWDEHSTNMDKAKRADLLIIDDIGKEYRSSDKAIALANTYLWDILEARSKRPTVLTSNYTVEELGHMKQYNGAITSRISGLATYVQLDGDDYRQQVLQTKNSLRTSLLEARVRAQMAAEDKAALLEAKVEA